jgi:nucleoside-diphosphate-sugar epimerase
MKILVTGGIGNVGRTLVARLVQHGHQVKVVDQSEPVELAGAEYAQCDITDFNALRQQVKGQEGIIHLAAIPYPGGAPGPEIFRINCAGTYNVFEAAALEGIRRVACASSINAFGYNFGIKSFPIRYLPIDEAHPGVTTDPYSFSKQITEEIAAYYWRREGISSICLRMPWVYEMNDDMLAMGRRFAALYQKAYVDLLAQPPSERQAFVHQKVRELDKRRALRLSEQPWDEYEHDEQEGFDPGEILTFGYTDFWAVISAEDSAQAFEQGLLVDYEGSHPLYVSEAQNMAGVDAEVLAQLFYPEVTRRSRPLVSKEPLVSFERARNLLGFEPEFSISDVLKGEG